MLSQWATCENQQTGSCWSFHKIVDDIVREKAISLRYNRIWLSLQCQHLTRYDSTAKPNSDALTRLSPASPCDYANPVNSLVKGSGIRLSTVSSWVLNKTLSLHSEKVFAGLPRWLSTTGSHGSAYAKDWAVLTIKGGALDKKHWPRLRYRKLL